MARTETAVIRAGMQGSVQAFATPPLPREPSEPTALAQTVMGEVSTNARDTAHAQGYAVGWAQGQREALRVAREATLAAEAAHEEFEQRREAEHRAAVGALIEAADRLLQATQSAATEVAERVESHGAELAFELAQAVLGIEVVHAGEQLAWARVAALAPSVGPARVRLHPSVAASIDPHLILDRGLQVIADPGLEVADAIVEAGGSVLDLQIGPALERVRGVLLNVE